MRRVSAAENCLPRAADRPRGSTPLTARICEEVATRYFGPFVEVGEAWAGFVPSEGASAWKAACERFVYTRDRLTPLVRPDDLLAGAFVRGDGPVGPGWKPGGEDWYVAEFAARGPKEPEWLHDMGVRGLISTQGPFNHKVVDYAGFLRLGCEALIAKATGLLAGRSGTEREIAEGFIEGHRCMVRTAERYADACEAMAERAEGEAKGRLSGMAGICRRVPARPAETFREAVQMLWFAYMVSGDGVGRPDQYLWEYYSKDLESGLIDKAGAQELVEAFMAKVHGEFFEGVFNVSAVQTLTLGGCDPEGDDACNGLTEVFLEAIRSVRLLRPNVYLRCGPGTPQRMLDLAVGMLAEGLGEPSFYGDAPVIEGLTRLGLTLRDARDYALSGCAEVVSPGKGNWGAPNGWINMAQLALEALRAYASELGDAEERPSGLGGAFGDGPGGGPDGVGYAGGRFAAGFWAAYGRMCAKVSEACSLANEYVDAENRDCRYESTIMYPFCLERGRHVMDGGLETHFGHWEGIGLPNAADMVYSALRLMGGGGSPSLADLLSSMEAGDAGLARTVLSFPKFGNDVPEVDMVAARLAGDLSESLESRSPGRRKALKLGHLSGGENMHIAYGSHMPATLDGRGAGMPLADSLTGSQGKAPSATSAINSVCRIDHSRLQAGNVSTLRLTPADFATERARLKVTMLIRAFVAKGGSQLQLNLVDAETLRKAQASPGEHAGLIVRVAGYSSAFDGLGRRLQDEIISRYEGY